VTPPTQSQIGFARSITANKTSGEIERKMRKLEFIHKGAGYPMYESLKIVLAERKAVKP